MHNKLAVSILLVLLLQAASNTSVFAQRRLPSVEVKELSGSTVNVASLSNNGNPMLVFVWEVTCQPALTQFTAIARKYADWQKETGVKIVAISVDDARSISKVQPLVRSRGWPFEVYCDPIQAFKRAVNINFCPYVFLLNGKGEICWQKGGYILGDEAMIYDELLKVAKRL
jgi:cytochrome c biogenesis protein CcmG, thiol:disulfide interchange protein DsbE